MKIVQLVFFLVSYAMILVFIVSRAGGTEAIDFPTLEIPTFDFIDLTGGCSGFTDCIEYLGAVIYNIGLGIIAAVVMVFNLVAFVGQVFVLLITIAIGGVEGAPWYVNILIHGPIIIMIGMIVYKLIRSGSTSD